MRQFLALSLFILSCFSFAQQNVDDPSSSLASTINDVLPDNVDMFSPSSWEDILDFSLSSTDNFQENLDLQEAPTLFTHFGDSDPDTLQSQCGSENGWAPGKVRVRDECKNRVSTQIKPDVFNSFILSPNLDPEVLSVTSILSGKGSKCLPPYRFNLCCNGAPYGFSGVENFFKIWTTIPDCDLSIVFSTK